MLSDMDQLKNNTMPMGAKIFLILMGMMFMSTILIVAIAPRVCNKIINSEMECSLTQDKNKMLCVLKK